MSGYEKSSSSSLEDYGSSRPLEDNNASSVDFNASTSARNSLFLTDNDQGIVEDQVRPLSPYDRQGDQMAFPASSYYQPTSIYDDEQPQLSNYSSGRAPEVTSYKPRQGTQGSQVFVCLESRRVLLPSITASLMFATRRCPSLLTPLESRGESYQYVLTTDVPELSSTGWYHSRVPLQLQLYDNESAMDAGSIDLGYFTYTDAGDHQDRTSPEGGSRKRKAPPADPSDLMRILPAKRASYEQLSSSGEIDAYSSNRYTQSEPFLSPPKANSPPRATLMPAFESYAATSQGQRRYTSTRNSRPLLTAPPPENALLSSTTSAAQQSAWYPAPALNCPSHRTSAPVARTASTSSPASRGGNPPLVRTSTLPPPTSQGAAELSRAVFNPYTMYPSKAVLKINGELDSMADRWAPEEWSMKRRLVRFWRSQSGSTITTHFDRVSPEERPPDSICISCILWEERQKCYVTSVDTIYLLEALVAVRFTVEEKNRIRRNLEALRPLTVSKGKSDTESFFRVIMGFPNPRPRNIEKDVKVFPWKELGNALRKIISKYSASYASTASALPPTPSHRTVRPAGGVRSDNNPAKIAPELSSERSSMSSSSTSSSAFTTSIVSSNNLISPNLSYGRISIPTYPETSVLQHSPVRRLPHAYSMSAATAMHIPPPPGSSYYASQGQLTSSSLGQNPRQAVTGCVEPGQQSITSSSLDFSSFVRNSPLAVDNFRNSYLPQHEHEP